MSTLVRRFIIVTLLCANFAILFTALVVQPSQKASALLGGPSAHCSPAAFRCGLAL
jgi:hypothetical protein